MTTNNSNICIREKRNSKMGVIRKNWETPKFRIKKVRDNKINRRRK